VERGFAEFGEVGKHWPFVLAAGGRDVEDAVDEAGVLRPVSPEHPLADPTLADALSAPVRPGRRLLPEGTPGTGGMA